MHDEDAPAADGSAPAAVAHLAPPPPQLTDFIGRARQLEEIEGLLAAGRLVTLTGSGGSGKTRIAVEVVKSWAESGAAPVGWVDLAPLADPKLLARHVAAALGIGEQPGRSQEETLVAELCSRALVLVLDNCEHLVDACAALVRSLLLGCARMRVLATSREALGVAGETAWLVPPLSLPAPDRPDAASVAGSEAGQLFVRRAREANAAFELGDGNAAEVAAICRRLDGIPLALELAAARVRLLDPVQIARRLDDVFRLLSGAGRVGASRHRTLREAIDWSHALLDDGERVLFRRLGVFAGGFTLEALEAVCTDAPLAADDVLDVLAGLVDKSMVRPEPLPDEARFVLLEPMRQYALERLREADETEALRERHARYFLALAETAEPHIRGGMRGSEWMDRLERDHGNLRVAADRADEHTGGVETALRLGSALLWFHFSLGLFDRPRQRLERALARAEEAEVPPVARGRALATLGYLAIWQGDHPAVGPRLAAAVDILRPTDDPESLAFALIGLATAAGLGGDPAAAHALLDEAQAALGGRDGAARQGYPAVFLFAFAEYWRGVVAQTHGDVAGARACFETSVSVAREFGDHPTRAHPLAALVRVLALAGDLDGAEAALAESLPIHARNEDRWGLVQALDGAAHVSAGRGDPHKATRLLAAADAIRARLGAALPPHERVDRERLAESLRAELGGVRFEELLGAGRAVPLEQAVAEAIGAPAGAAGVGNAEAASPPAGPPGGLPRAAAGPEPGLRVLALGPLRILRDGRDLSRDAFGPAKPRELLLLLLTRTGGATRDQVGAALWPDQPSARVANSFHVTLHRLRKALGGADTVQLRDERYAVAPELRPELDAAAFEREAIAAVAAARAGRADPAALAAALDLYRGPFLEDEVVGDWHLETRDRLQRVYVEALLALGAVLVAGERHGEAAEAYRRALAADDLQEDAYRGLMTCLARTGDRAGALRLFNQLTVLLRDELDAEPEAETVELFERLQQAQPA